MAILISTKDKSSQTSEGLVRLSTDVEASAGLRNDIAVTPAGLKAALDALVDGAPAALDTLNELAAAMNDDASFFATVNSDIADLQTQINTLAGGDLSGLQDEIDDTQVGAGLGTDGSYTAPSSSNYLSSATSLFSADSLLDAQIKANADAIATMGSGNLSAIQSEIDAIESSVGINSDGTFTAQSGNYISSATSVRGEISALDTQIKTNTDAISNLASSSAITALQSELDASQAGVGLSSSGAYVSRSGTNYIDTAASVVGEITLLDTQIKTNADAIALKAASSTVSALDTRVGDNESDIATLQSDVSGKASQSDLTALTSRVTTAEGEIDTLQTESADYESRISSLESGSSNTSLQTEIDAVESSVGIDSDGGFTANSGGNYISSASSVRGEINALDTQLKSTQDDLDTAESNITTLQSDVAGKASSSSVTSLQSEVDDIESAVGLGTDGSFTANSGGNYIQSATSVRGEINALDTQVATNAGDISNLSTTVSTLTSGSSSNAADIAALQSEVDNTQTGAGLGSTGAYGANSGSNYIATATSLKDADDKLDAQIKTNANAIALKADSSTVSALSSTVSGHTTDISTNASNISTNATNIASNLSAIQSNDSDISSLQSSKADASTVSTLQSEVDDIESAVGLSSSGAYTTPTSSNYLGGATVKAELVLLDTQLASTQSDLDTAESDISSLQSLADTHEASIGLNADGSYTAIAGNYAVSSTSLKAAVGQLDTQVKTNADAIALRATSSQLSTLQSEVDAVESAVGLATDGTFSSFSGQNYLNSATSIKGGMELLDAAIKTRQDNIDSEASTRSTQDGILSGKIDTVEASVGLQTDGSLSISGTNYLDSSSSIVGALDTLDTNQKLIADIQGNIKTSVGLSTDGTKTAYSSTNYISGSLKAAIEALDAQVKSNADGISGLGGSDIANLQSELNDTQAGVGLDANGDYVSRSGTNYLDSATSIVGEITALDTQVKSNADNIALKANSTTLSALDLRVTHLEIGDGGILLDHASDDAVEMDATISSFQSKSGPFQISLASLVSSGTTDLIFFGSKGERDGDRHFAIHPTSGDAIFAGKHS